MASKRTIALDVSPAVRNAVNKRQEIDGYPNCIFGHPSRNLDMAHYIPRSQSGLGIEENIIGLCRDCHRRLDHTGERQILLRLCKEYLQSKYPDWNEENLKYRRE